jgi:hypothetical protein
MPNIDTTHTAEPTCYRHPDRVTYLSCGRCGKPLCPDCSQHGPVGIRCEECLRPVGRMVAEAHLAAPEREGPALRVGALVATAGVVLSVVIALLQIPSAAMLSWWASEQGAPPEAIATINPHAIIAEWIAAGAIIPGPNLLAAMVIGGLVGWAVWRTVGGSSNKRTAWTAFLLGVAIPVLAALGIALAVTIAYGTPALFANPTFWVRTLVATGLSSLFAWLLGTQRRWASRDI